MNRTNVIAVVALAGAALASSAAAQTYTTQARWVVGTPSATYLTNGATSAVPATGATSFVLTLQGRAIFTGTFPASSSSALFGNLGIFSIGFGPGGATQPTTITRTSGGVTTSLARGTWGSFTSSGAAAVVDPDTGDIITPAVPPTTVGPFRGATPGNFSATANGGNGGFTRGFRFFGSPTTSALDSATSNGNGNDDANGRFGTDGNLSLFNLLRDDFQTGIRQGLITNQTTGSEAGTPNWMNLYRVEFTSAVPLTVDASGTVTVDFAGYMRASDSTRLVGSSWTMNAGTTASGAQSILTTAQVRFAVPTPGAAALIGLGGLAAARRRR